MSLAPHAAGQARPSVAASPAAEAVPPCRFWGAPLWAAAARAEQANSARSSASSNLTANVQVVVEDTAQAPRAAAKAVAVGAEPGAAEAPPATRVRGALQLLWCTHDAFTDDWEFARSTLAASIQVIGGSLSCFKRVIRLEEWMGPRGPTFAVLLAGWRQAKRCLSLCQRWPQIKRPVCFIIHCDSEDVFRKAQAWLQRNPDLPTGVHLCMRVPPPESFIADVARALGCASRGEPSMPDEPLPSSGQHSGDPRQGLLTGVLFPEVAVLAGVLARAAGDSSRYTRRGANSFANDEEGPRYQ